MSMEMRQLSDFQLKKFSESLSSCTDAVISNQDLLTLILLRVPIRSLLKFETVSKHWLSLITSLRFSLLRNALPLRASALFIQPPASFFGVPNIISFVSIDDHHNNQTISPFRNQSFAHDPYKFSRIRIVHSCGGLLLCSSCPIGTPLELFTLYIYNPTTNHLVTLPKHWELHYTTILAFDPSKSPHYKVFVCGIPPGMPKSHGRFQIYSSETGSWRASGQPFTFTSNASRFVWRNGVYFNGCIHWISCKLEFGCSYFNLHDERLETMPRPPVGQDFHVGVSENHLHVIEFYPQDTRVDVYEMKNDYSGWFVKYKVDLSPVCQVFPEMSADNHLVYILSLITREKFEEDPFLVFQIPNKVIRYNLMDRSFKSIWDFPTPHPVTSTPGGFKAFQYCESLSNV